MTWNRLDMLRSAINGTFSSYYSYNAAGDRVRKVVEKGNIREERLYLGNYERYRKYVNNILKTERQTVHIIDDRHRFALIDRLTIDNGITLSTATNSIRYQYDNHLGSASLELDQTAAIISYEEYHPFGTTSYRSGRTETEVSSEFYCVDAPVETRFIASLNSDTGKVLCGMVMPVCECRPVAV